MVLRYYRSYPPKGKEAGSIFLSTITAIRPSTMHDAPPHSLDLVGETQVYTVAAETRELGLSWAVVLADTIGGTRKPRKSVSLRDSSLHDSSRVDDSLFGGDSFGHGNGSFGGGVTGSAAKEDSERDITVYKRGDTVVAFGRLLKRGEGVRVFGGSGLRIGRGGNKDRFFFLDGDVVRYYYDEADFDLDQEEGSFLFQLGW
jgi:hypothetical protein